MRLTIGARKSDLARLQAYLVGEALQKLNPEIEVDYVFKASLGDRNLDDPLWTMGSKGVFTEDFYDDLVRGKLDLVVHSWKDLPMASREGTMIAATLPRADARDVLLVKKDEWESLGGRQNKILRILSSSPRRAHNLSSFLSKALPLDVNCEFVSVRGNIPTRLKKLMDGEGQALVVAKAALDRLLSATSQEFLPVQEQIRAQFSRCLWMVLPLSVNPTAAGQGALAIEVRKDINPEWLSFITRINCETTYANVERERDILAGFGGGCHLKIGVSVLTFPFGRVTFLQGLSPDGKALNSASLESRETADFPMVDHPEKLWPADPNERSFFIRKENFQGDRERIENPSTPLWVAHSEAWPEWLKPNLSQVVWTAGVKSWFRLAKKGVWVNGCSDSLGESQNPGLDALVGRPLDWIKLTHFAGHRRDDKKVMSTYKLEPLEPPPNLQGKTHFFWSSASAFFRAQELFPEIAQGYHGCGPGNTFEILKGELPPQRLKVFLSYEQWREQVMGNANDKLK